MNSSEQANEQDRDRNTSEDSCEDGTRERDPVPLENLDEIPRPQVPIMLSEPIFQGVRDGTLEGQSDQLHTT